MRPNSIQKYISYFQVNTLHVYYKYRALNAVYVTNRCSRARARTHARAHTHTHTIRAVNARAVNVVRPLLISGRIKPPTAITHGASHSDPRAKTQIACNQHDALSRLWPSSS